MKIDGWRYYNHAAIPTAAPHENPNMLPIEDGSIWKIAGGTPLLARWTTDFDCGYETNWWYVIKDAPFDLEAVAAKERKAVRQALKKSHVAQIDPTEHLDALYECYAAAFAKYKSADNEKSKEVFFASWKNNPVDCWAGFDLETGKLIGYMTVCVYDVYAEIQISKFHPDYLKLKASDALYYHVLDHYLNVLQKRFVSSGSRNINHITGSEEYKIRKLGYRKAYCHLHIEYNPKVKWLIKLIYPFRNLLKKLDRIVLVHQINSVLKMEEIVRTK